MRIADLNWQLSIEYHVRVQSCRLNPMFIFFAICLKLCYVTVMPSLRIASEFKDRMHFISSTPDLIAVVRDMKTFLSKELKKSILSTEPTVLRIFENKGKTAFWGNTNCPELIINEKFFKQKMDYIHFNPVRKQYVHLPDGLLQAKS